MAIEKCNASSADNSGCGCVVVIFLIIIFSGLGVLSEKLKEIEQQLIRIESRQISEGKEDG